MALEAEAQGVLLRRVGGPSIAQFLPHRWVAPLSPFPSAQSDVPKWREPNEVASFFPGPEEAGDGSRPPTLPPQPRTLSIGTFFFFLRNLQTGNRLSHNNTQERPVAEVTGSLLLVAARGTPPPDRRCPRRAVPPNAGDRRLAAR